MLIAWQNCGLFHEPLFVRFLVPLVQRDNGSARASVTYNQCCLPYQGSVALLALLGASRVHYLSFPTLRH